MAKKTEAAFDQMACIHKALEMAADRPWQTISLYDIAEAMDVGLADLHAHFLDKADILCVFGRHLDQQVLQNMDQGVEDLSVRERLFDLLMDRFDLLNDHRAGLISVLNSFVPDPKQAVISAPHLCRSMSWMLEAAGADIHGVRGALKVAGLTGIYLKALCVWKKDESADLSKTMAALDKALDRAERLIHTVGF